MKTIEKFLASMKTIIPEFFIDAFIEDKTNTLLSEFSPEIAFNQPSKSPWQKESSGNKKITKKVLVISLNNTLPYQKVNCDDFHFFLILLKRLEFEIYINNLNKIELYENQLTQNAFMFGMKELSHEKLQTLLFKQKKVGAKKLFFIDTSLIIEKNFFNIKMELLKTLLADKKYSDTVQTHNPTLSDELLYLTINNNIFNVYENFPTLKNLFSLSIESEALSEFDKDIIKKHKDIIKFLVLENFYKDDFLDKIDFTTLSSFSVLTETQDDFCLNAKNLTLLSLSMSSQAEKASRTIDLTLLEKLSILELTINVTLDNSCYPIILSNPPLALSTIILRGNYNTIDFIKPLIMFSENPILLTIVSNNILIDELYEFESNYPNLYIRAPLHKNFISKKIILPTNEDQETPFQNEHDQIIYEAQGNAFIQNTIDTEVHTTQQYTLKPVSRHLSIDKPMRFHTTRNMVFDLTTSNEIIKSQEEDAVILPIPSPKEISSASLEDDLYFFEASIDLNNNDEYILSSLTAYDDLYDIRLNGEPLQDSAVTLLKTNLGFYRLDADTPLKGKLTYILNVPNIKSQWDLAPGGMRQLAEKLQAFSTEPKEHLLDTTSNSDEKLEAMLREKKGACRHRVAIFLNQLRKEKEKHPEDFQLFCARGVIRGNYYHATIEYSIDNGNNWNELELGGHISKQNYLPPSIHLTFGHKKSQKNRLISFKNYLSTLDHKMGKNIFCVIPEDMNPFLYRLQIENVYHKPTFYIDTPDDLRVFIDRLELSDDKQQCITIKPPCGPLFNFVEKIIESKEAAILIINWGNFSHLEIVAHNTLIDPENRTIETVLALPPNLTIIGFHENNEKCTDLLNDTAFTSRQTGGICYLSNESLLNIEMPLETESLRYTQSTHVINLKGTSQWQRYLLGKAIPNGHSFTWQPGALIITLRSPSFLNASNLPILIKFINPPKDNIDFQYFCQSLINKKPYVFLNQMITLPENVKIHIDTDHSFPKNMAIRWGISETIPENALILSSILFEQCLHNKKITPDHKLAIKYGLLRQYKNKKLRCYLINTLSDSEWLLLTYEANKHNVHLEIIASHKMDMPLPEECVTLMDSEEITEINEKTHLIISTNDVDFSAYKIAKTLPHPIKIINISDMTPEELFYKISYHLSGDQFYFKKEASTILQSLLNGETIILKGKCSHEILHFYASLFTSKPYLYLEGDFYYPTGKLILILDENTDIPNALPVTHEKITHQDKHTILHLPEAPENKAASFLALLLERKKDEIAHFSEKANVITPNDYALETCLHFEKNRMLALKHIFSFSPFCVLEGAPCTGKSFFAQSLSHDANHFKLYHVGQIEEWATDRVDAHIYKILFFDNIDLQNLPFEKHTDILNNPSSLFYNNHYYLLDENCKILYAAHPGFFNNSSKFFDILKTCKITFDFPTDAFLLHRIIKPILESVFPLVECDLLAKMLLETSEKTIKDLQTAAIKLCADQIFGNEMTTPPLKKQFVCVDLSGFILTPSRYEIYNDFQSLLSMRRFKQTSNAHLSEVVRYEGKNGLLLEGAPGLGKSDFITMLLKEEGYALLNNKLALNEGDYEKGYFRITPGQTPVEKLKILKDCFDNGCIVVIDEIDTLKDINIQLNAYLTGRTEYGDRPQKPGFTLLSTCNGESKKGRNSLSPSLKACVTYHVFEEYPQEEMMYILETKFISPTLTHQHPTEATFKKAMIVTFVEHFMIEQYTATRDTKPTFRELYLFTKEYVEKKFDLYQTIGFSTEQQIFLLFHRNHSNIELLINQFKNGGLLASRVSLLDFEKLLFSIEKPQGFFISPQKNQDDSQNTAQNPLSPNR